MKLKLFIVLFFSLLVQGASAGLWSRSGDARQKFNTQQLQAIQTYIEENPDAHVIVASDLHDVALKRQSGDFYRFWALSKGAKGRFLKNIVPFGIKYLWYKIGFSATKPHLEQSIFYQVPCEEQKALLPLLSPFSFDDVMYKWYQQSAYPLIGFSNIGPASLAFMKKLYPTQMGVFDAIQCAGPEVQYRQKHEEKRYYDLLKVINDTLGYEPDAIFFIDDKRSSLDLCRRLLKKKHIETFAYQFNGADEFTKAVRAHAPALMTV